MTNIQASEGIALTTTPVHLAAVYLTPCPGTNHRPR